MALLDWRYGQSRFNTPKNHHYLGAFQYQNNELQQVSHAEGRVRYSKRQTINGQTEAYYWNYDFFYKDHLGNIRATVTDQQDQSQYKVTTEAAVQTQELSYSYYNTAHTRTRSQISGYTNTAEASNRVVRTLTYQSQRAFAYQTVLKVMAGDLLDVKVDYYYKSTETPTDLGTPEQDWWYWGFHGLLYQMFAQMGAGVNSSHFTAAQLQANGMASYSAAIGTLLTTRNSSPLVDASKPKAYLTGYL